MSYGEPIALRGQLELDQVAPATSVESRTVAEDQFIERLRRGDAAAFEVLVQERSSEIYGLLYRLTENSEEARDLTQETFLRAFQSISHFRGEADLRTWMYRIALNTVLTRIRRTTREPRREPLTDSIPDTRGTGERADGEMEIRRLYRAIDTLTDADKALILLHLDGHDYEEIATVTGLTRTNVSVRLVRIRRTLKRYLEGTA